MTQDIPNALGEAGGSRRVVGAAFYLERIQLPPGITLRVQLLDNRLADTADAVLAERELVDPPGPPYEFELSFDGSLVDPDAEVGAYGLHAGLRDGDGLLQFVTDTRIPVDLSSGEPVEFRMTRAL